MKTIKLRFITPYAELTSPPMPQTKAKEHELLQLLEKAASGEVDFFRYKDHDTTIIIPGRVLTQSVIEIIEEDFSSN